MTPFIVRRATTGDLVEIETLLHSLELPVAGVRDWVERFWLAARDGEIIGVAGIELYAGGALLRSVAVAPAWRSTGVARTLVERSLAQARTDGARDAFLLTTTADRYFPRLGFIEIARDAVPASVQHSVEFREACPASAVVMRRALA
jgi:amino-acid N-acetyltransferase